MENDQQAEIHKHNESRRKFLRRSALLGSLFILPRFTTVLANEPNQHLTGSLSAEPDQTFLLAFLDVTKSPFNADPNGKIDSTKAIQDAVNEARGKNLMCFFPIGTYLISDTISCEQRVQKLDKPRYTDDMRQSWWDVSSDKHYLIGSTKDGKRPVLKLSKEAVGFDNPQKPKIALKIWAQTRNDVPGTHEPVFGMEQPNISFGQICRGIDIDISGHAGAIGMRHAGSQGCLLMDCSVYAEGALAGFNNCPGQGGGTYNIATFGGSYGLLADPNYRFPMLAGCTFQGQTIAPVAYMSGSLPLLLVGCYLESNGSSVIDLTGTGDFPGVSLVDCMVKMNKPGVLVAENQNHNVFLENVLINGVTQLQKQGKKTPATNGWTEVSRYSNCAGNAENLINGVKSQETFLEWKPVSKAPSKEEIKAKHWRQLPSFEDKDAVNIKSFGAIGDGEADDTEAFKKAMKSSKKIFIPRGRFMFTEDIKLEPGMQIFGVKGSSITAPSLITHDDPNDDTFFSHVSVNGTIEWGSGKGVLAFANGRMKFTPNGGGRFYAMRGIGGGRGSGEDAGKLFEGTRQPIFLYTLNIERRMTNPQSFLRDVKHLRLFYLKSEASPVGYGVEVGPDSGNTPLAIIDSTDVKVYCACGNVLTSKQRPFIDVVNSHDVMVAQVKSFKTADFPNLRETAGDKIMEIGSDRVAALFIRD